jgi:hypothetical protein
MKRYGTYAAAALLLAASLGAAACGGDDDSDDASSDTTDETTTDSTGDSGTEHDRADYVALLGGGGEGFTDEEADCMAGALVGTIGVESLEASGAYEKIQANPDGNRSDFGITLDDVQGMTFYQGANACKDLRAFFAEELASGADAIPPEAATCMASSIDDATFARIWVVGFTQGDDAVSADPQVTAALTQAATDCAAAG